jgi:hypothetical protein
MDLGEHLKSALLMQNAPKESLSDATGFDRNPLSAFCSAARKNFTSSSGAHTH